ncbi:MAG: putative NAD/FAD-binding protein [Saprospiraceae bacterium]|jgi:predicted NAD/FAD-binding protein
MNLAVIGSGISGCVAAHLLSKEHKVTLYEASDRIGGHTHTHDINWDGQQFAIDTGFIVFNERTYPRFIKLLNRLGVKFEATEMSFSVKDDESGLEYNGHSLNTLFSQRKNLLNISFLKMIIDVLRFNRQALQAVEQEQTEVSLGEFLQRNNYSSQFIDNYIIPMGSAIWSTDPATMRAMPAHFFIRFFHNHGLLTVTDQPQWLVVSGGSKQYIAPLVERFKERIQLGCKVTQLERTANSVTVHTKCGISDQYDAVFVATHSDQALAMLGQPSTLEQQVLGNIKYQSNEAILHTDTSILPSNRRAWAAWNYHQRGDCSKAVALTYYMNRLQNLEAPVDFYVTLNHSEAIDPNKIIKKISYTHPVYTSQSVASQARLSEINGVNRTYFCGAYWGNGFHEDGVASALTAVNLFKQQLYE